MTDYRKLYENYYHIKWDRKKYEVHHKDRNRENNAIENLVLLPKKLHKEYHRLVSIIQYDFGSIEDIFNTRSYDIYHANEYQQFFEVKFEIANIYIMSSQFKFLYELRNKEGWLNYEEILKKYYTNCYKKYVGDKKNES